MKILTAACLCFASLIMYAAEINGFEISPSGAISKGGVSFAPGRHLKNWHYVGIREAEESAEVILRTTVTLDRDSDQLGLRFAVENHATGDTMVSTPRALYPRTCQQ